MDSTAIHATALHASAPDRLEALTDHVIVVGADGTIEAALPAASPDGAAAIEQHREAGKLTILEPGHWLLPGFVDLHVHAPQWPQMGMCLDLPLEEWLQRYTFPLEARYADLNFAREQYESLVSALLANGTTTALYFATIHVPASLALAEICLSQGQRALVGRVAMDDPGQCQDYYRDESAASGERDTRDFIDAVRALTGNARELVRPVVTPRFIPSCTDDLLHRLGRVAAETGCHVQTHCSESDWAHRHVLERHGVTDTQSLDGFGLLTRRTVLAHGNFIDAEDRATLRRIGTGIAHCPLSNAYFSGAVFPLRRALDEGLHVGLGTDIAGGASPSMLDSARQAVVASRLLESGVDPELPAAKRGTAGARIGAVEAFHLATAAGGVALDLPIGLFRPGYQFDAVEIDATVPGNLMLRPDEPPGTALEKMIYNAGRTNIGRVWVAGRLVRG